jgi:hypothetical protein
MKLTILNARAAFVEVFEPKHFNNDTSTPKAYSIRLLLGPDDPQVDAINEAIDKEAEAKWGLKAKGFLAQMRGADKCCLHNGDLKSNLDGHAGNYYLQARSLTKPLVLDRNRQQLDASSGLPYGGCYVNAVVEIYVTEKGGKKACCNLKGVQFVSHGDAFSGGPPASPEDFDDLGVDAENALA